MPDKFDLARMTRIYQGHLDRAVKQLVKAHALMESSKHMGKIVLEVA